MQQGDGDNEGSCPWTWSKLYYWLAFMSCSFLVLEHNPYNPHVLAANTTHTSGARGHRTETFCRHLLYQPQDTALAFFHTCEMRQKHIVLGNCVRTAHICWALSVAKEGGHFVVSKGHTVASNSLLAQEQTGAFVKAESPLSIISLSLTPSWHFSRGKGGWYLFASLLGDWHTAATFSFFTQYCPRAWR